MALVRGVRPERCLLVVVDVQNDFVSPRGYFARRGFDTSPFQQLVPRINHLARACRALGMPVWFTRQRFPPEPRGFGHRSVIPSHFLQEAGLPRSDNPCVEGTWGAELVGELDVAPGDRVIDKRTFSAFVDTDFERQLLQAGRRVLVFAGLTTEFCVESTVRDAFHRGFDCLVVSDCTAAWTPEAHQASLSVIDRGFGAVVSSDELLGLLSDRSSSKG